MTFASIFNRSINVCHLERARYFVLGEQHLISRRVGNIFLYLTYSIDSLTDCMHAARWWKFCRWKWDEGIYLKKNSCFVWQTHRVKNRVFLLRNICQCSLQFVRWNSIAVARSIRAPSNESYLYTFALIDISFEGRLKARLKLAIVWKVLREEIFPIL